MGDGDGRRGGDSREDGTHFSAYGHTHADRRNRPTPHCGPGSSHLDERNSNIMQGINICSGIRGERVTLYFLFLFSRLASAECEGGGGVRLVKGNQRARGRVGDRWSVHQYA